jgi:hypothetical protein
MMQYQIGDLVAVDRAALPSHTVRHQPGRTSQVSPQWLAALIEAIDARPGGAPAARYRIRILEGPCYGRSWPVSLGALRAWHHHTNHPPAPSVGEGEAAT